MCWDGMDLKLVSLSVFLSTLSFTLLQFLTLRGNITKISQHVVFLSLSLFIISYKHFEA